MSFYKSFPLLTMITVSIAVQFPTNPTSEMSADDRNVGKANKTFDQSDESGHEIEIDGEESKDKRFLDDAMKSVLDPDTIIIRSKDGNSFKLQLEELEKENTTLEIFMEEMDKLSLDVCKMSQEALWAYVTDTNSEIKKNKMVNIAAEEDEIKKQYWNILKRKYLYDAKNTNDLRLKRKLRVIKERGNNAQMAQSKQREEIDTMQRIWGRATVCDFNSITCDTTRNMNDIITLFKSRTDPYNSEELQYYWKAYRDVTGKKVRPIFKDYVLRMNSVARSENFKDAGDMWRYNFEDDNFLTTVDRVWREVKPLYKSFHRYVREKLKKFFRNDLQDGDTLIPGHILGNLWAQEWQAIYPMVIPYPGVTRYIFSMDYNDNYAYNLFHIVDKFHQSLGFESAYDSYQDIKELPRTANCLPSSHDMCDGVNYKIKWCEGIGDLTVELSRAARLLGHVQYFKHYRNLHPLFRDGPNPAFHDAISDIFAVQLTLPQRLRALGLVEEEDCPEARLNHLMWLALEKFPLMGYSYALDKWRWNVFANSRMENLNQHWWDIRIKETMISPPVPRNESDLDPASKYHVVSHVQYITYLISNILEFQILRSLCKKANHTGPLHECSLYGKKEAGKLLSDGMSLGASKDWRVVLQTMTGETELSTEGFLEYFSPLRSLFTEDVISTTPENLNQDVDKSVPIILGIVVIVLTFLMFVLYCIRKRDACSKIFSFCGLRKNGSLDIATNEMPRTKSNEIQGISEEKL